MPAARLAAEATPKVIGRREDHEGTVEVEVFGSKVARARRSRASLKCRIRI